MISHIYWGFDLKNLFFRLDTSVSPLSEEMLATRVMVHIDNKKRHRVAIMLPASPREKAELRLEEHVEGETWREVGRSDRVAARKIIEFTLLFEQLGLQTGDPMKFHVTVHKGPIEIERWPRSGYIEVSVPGEDFEATMWFV
jgi:hypothetical protein